MKHIMLTVAGRTDVGKRRGNNEDAFLITDLDRQRDVSAGEVTFEIHAGGALLAVSDGMGGAKAGEVASALVVESLRRGLDADSPRTQAIASAVDRANKEVWKAGREVEKRGLGATLTAVYIDGQVAHIAEVGDSRGYVIRGGRIRQVTRDQSYAQLLLDAGVLKPEDVASFPMKNIVLQAMGQKENVSVEIGRLQLRRGDHFLLCSDGLSNKLSAEEMKAIILSNPSVDQAAEKLIALANERGGEDNITAVVAKLDGDGLEEQPASESVTSTLEVVKNYESDKLPPRPASKAAVEAPAPVDGDPDPGSRASLWAALGFVILIAAAVAWFVLRQ